MRRRDIKPGENTDMKIVWEEDREGDVGVGKSHLKEVKEEQRNL